jgi:hypothetical protein
LSAKSVLSCCHVCILFTYNKFVCQISIVMLSCLYVVRLWRFGGFWFFCTVGKPCLITYAWITLHSFPAGKLQGNPLSHALFKSHLVEVEVNRLLISNIHEKAMFYSMILWHITCKGTSWRLCQTLYMTIVKRLTLKNLLSAELGRFSFSLSFAIFWKKK